LLDESLRRVVRNTSLAFIPLEAQSQGRCLAETGDRVPDFPSQAFTGTVLLNSETSEAYGSTQTGVAFTADTQ